MVNNNDLFLNELNNYLNLKISNVGCRFRNASGKEKLHLEIPVELLEFVSNDCPIQGEYSKRVSKVC